MVAFHARFDARSWTRVISRNDSSAFYVASVRDAAEQFRSLYTFVGYGSFYGSGRLANFLRAPRLYFRHSYIRPAQRLRQSGLPYSRWPEAIGRDAALRLPPARNPQLFDFGMRPSLFNDAAAVHRKIDEIDRTFNLIIILERIDESLLLMRRMLCLDWEEILLMHTNERRQHWRSGGAYRAANGTLLSG